MQEKRTLSTARMIAYAAGGIAMNLTDLIISQWLLFRYLPEGGGDPLISGLVFGGVTLTAAVTFSLFFSLGRITDAITDPLVGYWSDHLVSKRGRRIPFILYGVGPFALVFFLMWNPPVDGPSTINAIFVFVLIQSYFVLYTVVIAPYLALIPEIVSEPKQRVNLTTLQAVFVLVSTLMFGASGLIISAFGWTVMAASVAVLAALALVPTLLFIREPDTRRRRNANRRASFAGSP